MNTAIRWLRISYWTGAVADGFFAIALAWPALWGLALGLPGFAPDLQHRIDMGVGASLMLSWTVLLLWADRKPVERKGVLLLTVFPALTCLALTGLAAVVTGANSLLHMLPLFVMQSLLFVLFITSYILARRAESAAKLK
ncbi:MAG TPA: hypothetical protein VN604_10115 [Nitrospirota bacterium]|nr:hypothetical protein [Nitrospirota bacterium]